MSSTVGRRPTALTQTKEKKMKSIMILMGTALLTLGCRGQAQDTYHLTKRNVVDFNATMNHVVGMDQRLDGMDRRLGGIDQKLGNMDQSLTAVQQDVSQLCGRRRPDPSTSATSASVNNISTVQQTVDLSALDEQLAVAQQVAQRFCQIRDAEPSQAVKDLEEKYAAWFQGTDGRLDDVEQELDDRGKQVDSLIAGQDAIAKRQDAADTRVNGLEHRVTALEDRAKQAGTALRNGQRKMQQQLDQHSQGMEAQKQTMEKIESRIPRSTPQPVYYRTRYYYNGRWYCQ